MSMDAAVWTLVGAIVALCIATFAITWQMAQGLGARIDAQGASLSARIDAQGASLSARIDAQGAELRAEIHAQTARIDAQGAELRAEIHAQTARIDAQTARIDHLADEVAGVKTVVDTLDTRLSHVEHAA